MILYIVWWFVCDFICRALATRRDIPDLNRTPPSSPVPSEGNGPGNAQNAEQSRLNIFTSQQSIDGIRSGRTSAFREWRRDGQDITRQQPYANRLSTIGSSGALPFHSSMQSDNRANIPQSVSDRFTDDEIERNKKEKTREKWKEVQKRRRKNLTKEQKKKESDKKYERYRARMCIIVSREKILLIM